MVHVNHDLYFHRNQIYQNLIILLVVHLQLSFNSFEFNFNDRKKQIILWGREREKGINQCFERKRDISMGDEKVGGTIQKGCEWVQRESK